MATLTSIINNIIQKVNNLTSSKVNKVTSIDNAIVRFNGTTGEVQNSSVIIDDNGNITGAVSISGKASDSDKLDGIDSSGFTRYEYASGQTRMYFLKTEAGGSCRIGAYENGWINRLDLSDRLYYQGQGLLYSNEKASDSNLLDGLDSTQFMRTDTGNTISSNIIFNNGSTDTNGFSFQANGSYQDIHVDMNNGKLRWFRNNGLEPFSIGTDNNLYSNNGTNGNGKVWTSAIDGAGSGLDADLLDGLDSSQFMRSDVTNYVGNMNTFSNNISNQNFETLNSPSKGIMIQSDSGTNSDAMITFHNGGSFACHLGLDRTTNDLAVGGWSMGAVANKVWHNGNSPIVKQGTGYCIYANGNIEQWGLIASSATQNIVNFPIAFPTRCVFASATLLGTGATYASLNSTPTTTQVVFNKSNGYNALWYAVGH